jgi:hypothetical protein
VANEGAVPTAAAALQPAAEGTGPLLQRDYWAVIDNCRCRPSEVVTTVASRFPEFAPDEIVVFDRDRDRARHSGQLDVGDELDIQIRLAGAARVRVVHTCPCSLTLATLKGHPEAGRITFGAYRNDAGAVIFHIRSRARSSSFMAYLGFLVGGNPMQTETWTGFVNAVALTCGDGVSGEIHAETTALDAAALEPGDDSLDCPTFVAESD